MRVAARSFSSWSWFWALSWPAINVGVSAVPPVWFASLRYVVATLCAFGFVAIRGELRRPSPSDWRLVAVSGVLQMATYSALTRGGIDSTSSRPRVGVSVLDAALGRAAFGVVAG
jgi:drug/metabolite transporter (DMT)-like permease